MTHRKYTVDQLMEAVKESTSYAQVLSKVGLVPAGGNYETIKKAITFYDLDSSHFTGQGWNKGKTFGPKRPIEDYLSNKYPTKSYRLKERLINDGYLDSICSNCNLTQWLGDAIPLELHHKDGDHNNNNLDNLQLLCPNCHTLTDTYRRKKTSI